jgi:hypothetical protein
LDPAIETISPDSTGTRPADGVLRANEMKDPNDGAGMAILPFGALRRGRFPSVRFLSAQIGAITRSSVSHLVGAPLASNALREVQ